MEAVKIYQVLRADNKYGIDHIGFFTSYEEAYTKIIEDIEWCPETKLAISDLSKLITEITTTTEDAILVKDNNDTEYLFTYYKSVICKDNLGTQYQILKFSLNQEV